MAAPDNYSPIDPRDHRGRSLRDFDLEHRLFKYPCSYLIYSPSFQSLPDEAKQYIYVRFHSILTGQDQSMPFVHLTASDRPAILEILRETIPSFRDYCGSRVTESVNGPSASEPTP